MSDDELLTSKEVAKQLKVSESWVKDHALGRRLPLLPSFNLGLKRGLVRFHQRDINRFLEDNRRNGKR